MTQILGLKEPLKSFIEKLDTFELSARDGQIAYAPFFGTIGALPTMDPDDARELVAELNAAMLPIIRRFRDRKLAEFMPTAQPMSDDTFRTLINRH